MQIAGQYDDTAQQKIQEFTAQTVSEQAQIAKVPRRPKFSFLCLAPTVQPRYRGLEQFRTQDNVQHVIRHTT